MKCCLCNDICKWLDFLVFLDENKKKPYVPSHRTFTYLALVGRKLYPHHCSKRVGDVDPGSVVISFPGMGGLDRNV